MEISENPDMKGFQLETKQLQDDSNVFNNEIKWNTKIILKMKQKKNLSSSHSQAGNICSSTSQDIPSYPERSLHMS